uniref:AAA+ ATPase domain-containing protein n=1 Tax=Kalanchoe fedtschenkoi TaxID=63787 RepID=A0A7N0US05_KALFE
MEKMDEGEAVCWRKQVDRNLKRLQSLLFGAEQAIDKQDYAAAEILLLSLIGFLDSQTHSDVDEAYIRPLRREACEKLEIARKALRLGSDSFVFEQLGQTPAPVFGMKGSIDVEKIKQSKYFRAMVKSSESRSGNELERRDKANASKALTQTKLTSLYGNLSGANNRSNRNSANASEDCMLVDKVNPFTSQQARRVTSSSSKMEEERISLRNNLGTKRLHMDISSSSTDLMKSPSSKDDSDADQPGGSFVTARAKLELEARQRCGGRNTSVSSPQGENGAAYRGYGLKSYGVSRRGVRGNFIPPIKSNGGTGGSMTSRNSSKGDDALDESTKKCLEMLCGPDGELPEKLRNLEPRLLEHVSNEIMDRDPNVRWDDIAGLEHAKKCVTEMVIWPLLRPDIFKGCRSPGRGLLLFGPPGTGKTMIGKAIAGEAKATFFYISASSLTSKWIGEGEKLVRALFGVACCRQPAVIFVDEIDSLLSQRKSEGEHESSRRLKTQFLIEMEGFDSGNEQILLIGATNRPQELDEAARRRLTKRLYIPLPSSEARAWIIRNLLEKDGLFKLTDDDTSTICKLTEGYSGSDMKNLVKDASMGPLREALRQGIEITKLRKEDMRPVTLQDFENALREVRPSVSPNELHTYENWNKQFGSLAI